VINTLIGQFKKELTTMTVDLLSTDQIALYEKRYHQTREVIAKYLQPVKPTDDIDEPDALEGFEPFGERPPSDLCEWPQYGRSPFFFLRIVVIHF
jgi:hypothetical protein